MINPVRFSRESYSELKKVTWIPRKQMIASTFVVILLVLILSLYISLVDYLVVNLFGIFIRI